MMASLAIAIGTSKVATITNVKTNEMREQSLITKSLITKVGRIDNGSLGEYEFLRSDCIRGSIRNSLNFTTVLPPLTASALTGSCLKGNGTVQFIASDA